MKTPDNDTPRIEELAARLHAAVDRYKARVLAPVANEAARPLADVIPFPTRDRAGGWAVEDHAPCPFGLNRWCLRCDGK